MAKARAKTKTRAKAKGGRKAARRAPKKKLTGAAKRAAEFLGMDPDEVADRADKLRASTRKAGDRIRREVEKLGVKADGLTSKIDEGVKKGVGRVEELADEVVKGLGVKPDEVGKKIDAGLDRVSKETSRLVDEAGTEMKKMYQQARERLEEILKKNGGAKPPSDA